MCLGEEGEERCVCERSIYVWLCSGEGGERCVHVGVCVCV